MAAQAERVIYFSSYGADPNQPFHMAWHPSMDEIASREKPLLDLVKKGKHSAGLGVLPDRAGQSPSSPRHKKGERSKGDSVSEDIEDNERQELRKSDSKNAASKIKTPSFSRLTLFLRVAFREQYRAQFPPGAPEPSDQQIEQAMPGMTDGVLVRLDDVLDYYTQFEHRYPEPNSGPIRRLYNTKRLNPQEANRELRKSRALIGRLAGYLFYPKIGNVEKLRGNQSYPLSHIVNANRPEYPEEVLFNLSDFANAVRTFLSLGFERQNGGIVFPKMNRGSFGKKRERIVIDNEVRMSLKPQSLDGRMVDEGTDSYQGLCTTEKASKRIDRARQMISVAKGFSRKAEEAERLGKAREVQTYGNRARGFEHYAGRSTVDAIMGKLNKRSEKSRRYTKLPNLQGEDDPFLADNQEVLYTKDGTNRLVQQAAERDGYKKVPGSGSSRKRNATNEFLDAYRLIRTFEKYPQAPLSFVDSESGKKISPERVRAILENDALVDQGDRPVERALAVSVVPNPCRICEEGAYGFLVGTRRGADNHLDPGCYGRLIWNAYFYVDPHGEAWPQGLEGTVTDTDPIYGPVTQQGARRAQAYSEFLADTRHFETLPLEEDFEASGKPFEVEFETDVGRAIEVLEKEVCGPGPESNPLVPGQWETGMFEMRIPWCPSEQELSDPVLAKRLTSRDIACIRLLKLYILLVPESLRRANFNRYYFGGEPPEGNEQDWATEVSDDAIREKAGMLYASGMMSPLDPGDDNRTYKDLRIAEPENYRARDVLLHLPYYYFVQAPHPTMTVAEVCETAQGTDSILSCLAAEYRISDPQMLLANQGDDLPEDRTHRFRLSEQLFDLQNNNEPVHATAVPHVPYLEEHRIYREDRFAVLESDGTKYYYAPVIKPMSTGVRMLDTGLNIQGYPKPCYRLGRPDPELGFPKPGTNKIDARMAVFGLESKKTFSERKMLAARLRERIASIGTEIRSGRDPSSDVPTNLRWWEKGPRATRSDLEKYRDQTLPIKSREPEMKASLELTLTQMFGSSAYWVLWYCLIHVFGVFEGQERLEQYSDPQAFRQAYEAPENGPVVHSWDEVQRMCLELRAAHEKSHNVGPSSDIASYWPTGVRKVFPCPNNKFPRNYIDGQFHSHRASFRLLFRYYVALALDGQPMDQQTRENSDARADRLLAALLDLRCRLHALYQLRAPLAHVPFFRDHFPSGDLVVPDPQYPDWFVNRDNRPEALPPVWDATSNAQTNNSMGWASYLHPSELADPALAREDRLVVNQEDKLWSLARTGSTTDIQLKDLLRRDYASNETLGAWLVPENFAPVPNPGVPFALYEPMGPVPVDAWFGCYPVDPSVIEALLAGDTSRLDAQEPAAMATAGILRKGPVMLYHACFDGLAHFPGETYAASDAALSKPSYFCKTSNVGFFDLVEASAQGQDQFPQEFYAPGPAGADHYPGTRDHVTTHGIEYF